MKYFAASRKKLSSAEYTSLAINVTIYFSERIGGAKPHLGSNTISEQISGEFSSYSWVRYFPVLLRNRLISTGLKPVLSHSEK